MSILTLQQRVHESGRIRLGKSVPAKSRSGKDIRRPVKLATFVFTSQHERFLHIVAELWGGTVDPWPEAPVGRQWRVETESSEIPCFVPPQHFAFSQHFEAWEGGGCTRRCDGQTMEGGASCRCEDEDERVCKPTTRVSLLLPQLPGSGLWRLESHGYNAAGELESAFAMAQMLQEASGRPLLPATLRLTERESRKPGQPVARFMVPVIDFDLGPALASLAAGSTLALGAGGNGNGHAAPTLPALPGAAPHVTPLPSEPPQSLRDALEEIEQDVPRARRANAAEPIRRTGRAPRTAAAARDGAADGSPSPELAEDAEPAAGPSQAPTPTTPPAPAGPKMTASQQRYLFRLLAEQDITTDQERHDYAAATLRRPVESYTTLTIAEANALIEDLQAHSAVESGETTEPRDESAPPALALVPEAPGPTLHERFSSLTERNRKRALAGAREAGLPPYAEASEPEDIERLGAILTEIEEDARRPRRPMP